MTEEKYETYKNIKNKIKNIELTLHYISNFITTIENGQEKYEKCDLMKLLVNNLVEDKKAWKKDLEEL